MSREGLTDTQVLDETRMLVGQGQIRWSAHAEQRMAERGYERGQIKECLLSGYFIEPPTVPNMGGNLQYKFRIHGNIDGEAIEVVASLVPENRVVVITVIDPNSQS